MVLSFFSFYDSFSHQYKPGCDKLSSKDFTFLRLDSGCILADTVEVAVVLSSDLVCGDDNFDSEAGLLVRSPSSIDSTSFSRSLSSISPSTNGLETVIMQDYHICSKYLEIHVCANSKYLDQTVEH